MITRWSLIIFENLSEISDRQTFVDLLLSSDILLLLWTSEIGLNMSAFSVWKTQSLSSMTLPDLLSQSLRLASETVNDCCRICFDFFD